MLSNLIRKMTGKYSTKMVFVVRTDLKMGQGKIAAQCAHAAVSLYQSALRTPKTPLNAWLLSGQPKIVLRANTDSTNKDSTKTDSTIKDLTSNSEKALRELYDAAQNLKLNSCLVYDSGRTQVERGTLTVLGIGPARTEDVDKITQNLKLL